MPEEKSPIQWKPSWKKEIALKEELIDENLEESLRNLSRGLLPTLRAIKTASKGKRIEFLGRSGSHRIDFYGTSSLIGSLHPFSATSGSAVGIQTTAPFIFQSRDSDPPGEEGMVYWNKTNKRLRLFSGNVWVTIGTIA